MSTLSLDSLLEKNQVYIEKFKTSALMQLIQDSKMEIKENRKKLLDAIQTFSNYFQKTVLLRHVLTEQKEFYAVTQQHLKEEFGHNELLMKDRDNRLPVWDPILEATSAWFVWKMFTSNDEEKTVLVHLVLETSANIFFQAADRIMSHYKETGYFKIHADVDEQHDDMGKELLMDLSQRQYARLLEIQRHGWDILNAACDRIAEINQQYCESHLIYEM